MRRPRFTRQHRVAAALIAAAAVVAALGPGSVSQASAAGSTRYLGIFREATPTQIASATSSTYGVTPASVMWFNAWATGAAFPVAEAKALWSQGILPHFTWEPWNTSLGVNDAGQIHLQDIINGSWDSYIRARAAEFASVGAPLLVRFGHEFNGNWYPWAVSTNGDDPSLFVRAYQHVHDVVRAAGATNVQWVWAFSNSSTPSASWNDPALAYPGSSYVDWVGIDGYNWGLDPSWDPTGNHWTSFSDIFSSAYQQARTIAPNKPVMIAEFASSEDGGDKAAWIQAMSSQLQAGSWPDLKLLTYFDQDKEELWSGSSSAATLAAFTSWVKQPFMAGKGADLAQVAAQYSGTPTSSPATSSPTTSSPTTSSPTTSSPTTSSPTGGTSPSCTATYQVTSQWTGGFQGAVTVRNSANTPMSGWTVVWTLPSGQTVTQAWNGTLSVSGSTITLANASWNGSLAPGAAASAGFLGTFTGSTPSTPSVSCTAR
jgi:Cellulose binding domain/Glycosyl hydrolase family 26